MVTDFGPKSDWDESPLTSIELLGLKHSFFLLHQIIADELLHSSVSTYSASRTMKTGVHGGTQLSMICRQSCSSNLIWLLSQWSGNARSPHKTSPVNKRLRSTLRVPGNRLITHCPWRLEYAHDLKSWMIICHYTIDRYRAHDRYNQALLLGLRIIYHRLQHGLRW